MPDAVRLFDHQFDAQPIGTAENPLPVSLSGDGSNLIGSAKDAGLSWVSVYGVSGARFTSADQHSAAASVTDAPTSGQKLVMAH